MARPFTLEKGTFAFRRDGGGGEACNNTGRGDLFCELIPTKPVHLRFWVECNQAIKLPGKETFMSLGPKRRAVCMKSKLRIRFYNSVCLVYCLGEKNDLLNVFKYRDRLKSWYMVWWNLFLALLEKFSQPGNHSFAGPCKDVQNFIKLTWAYWPFLHIIDSENPRLITFKSLWDSLSLT